jgi:hypothetical protein
LAAPKNDYSLAAVYENMQPLANLDDPEAVEVRFSAARGLLQKAFVRRRASSLMDILDFTK